MPPTASTCCGSGRIRIIRLTDRYKLPTSRLILSWTNGPGRLVGEENRRMTLVRTGTLVERVQNYLNAYNTGAGQPVTGLDKVTTRKGLLPIPQTAIDLNKGAVLAQNVGY